jgi:cytochrome c
MRGLTIPGLALFFAACGGEAAIPAAGGASTTESYAPTATFAAGHFGIGATPTPAHIAAWDTDIGPEGTELPEGRGNAREGAELYRTQCAACHGMKGEGMAPAFPALIGRDPRGEDFNFASDPGIPRTIGNYWSHATTLYDYIRRAMPLYTPGSLSTNQTYAVTAYLLAANRVIPDTAALDAASLRAIKMPARDRYVADDRSPSTR